MAASAYLKATRSTRARTSAATAVRFTRAGKVALHGSTAEMSFAMRRSETSVCVS